MVVETIPQTVGPVYAMAGILAFAYLWWRGFLSRRRAYPFLAVTAMFGFLIFAPVAPYQLQGIVLGEAGPGVPVGAVAFGLGVMLVLAFVFGRMYCGHFCPVGALQEIASLLPVRKVGRTQKAAPMAVRGVVFALFLVAGLLYSYNLLGALGIRDFFYLVPSVSAALFLVILALSAVVYRPFCRFVCPFGALLAVPSSRSRVRFVRTDLCIECGACERACPVDEAKRGDAKAECYMCGRCMEVCPVEGALVYRRPDE
ncbi:4Fe-4S binding protein [Methanofollis fontis]|uniref:4Fe-4S ferredoxin n=1 Tax=Methanofollis fontis TaxID=2052832 RepID=A0A483CZL4_9EURY|nr:4Fe-4S binding protein [Methanofollis fontis]TAJ45852.1 4Fe-4S ferredoxin [Methanofollis fontis]